MGGLAALVVAGIAANQFPFPLFLNIDLLFGSIFAMLALQHFGFKRGVLAAALIASPTWTLWNHPYAIAIMTAEAATVGWLMRRFDMGMARASAIYWLLLGMPLVWFFYAMVMGTPTSSLGIIMMKQALNGVANALVARLIYTTLFASELNRLVSFRELIANLLTAFLLLPALVMVAVSSRQDFAEIDDQVRSSLQQHSQASTQRLGMWLDQKTQVVTALTGLAGRLSVVQMQERLDQARASDSDFLRIGMRDVDSVVAAYSPAVDEEGQSNVGKKFPERPYIATLRATLQPMLAEVVVARIGKPEPIAILLAPVVRDGLYAGYVNSVLQLDRIRSLLDSMFQGELIYYTVLDQKGQIVLTNQPGQKPMTPISRGPGELVMLDGALAQWVPAQAANRSISERWKQSSYVVQATVGDPGGPGGWQLVLEEPLAPIQQRLYEKSVRLLSVIFAAMLLALWLAWVLGRRATATLDALTELTRDLPQRLANGGDKILWPQSTVRQTRLLIDNFKTMAESLERKFHEVRLINESLDRRVQERTAELAISEAKHRQLVDNSHDIIFILDANGVCSFMSPAWVQLTGHPVNAVVGRPLAEFVHPDDQAHCEAARLALFKSGQRQLNVEYRVQHRDGSWRWHSLNELPLRDAAGRVVALEGSAKDVTEHKESEELVRQLAFYDTLTGLPNRRLLVERLRQAMVDGQRSGQHGSLMFLDLDHFKTVNDTHGHSAGDQVLVAADRRLQACVREVDTVARFGGDEYVVMLGGLAESATTAKAQALTVAEKIRSSLAAPFRLSVTYGGEPSVDIECLCPASIGVVVFMGNRISDEELMRRADKVMYEAKQAGRNGVSLYGELG